MLGSGVTFGYVGYGPWTLDLAPWRCLTHLSESNLMLTSILPDSFFMSIGSVIRTEGNSPLATEAFARAKRQPKILPRSYVARPRH